MKNYLSWLLCLVVTVLFGFSPLSYGATSEPDVTLESNSDIDQTQNNCTWNYCYAYNQAEHWACDARYVSYLSTNPFCTEVFTEAPCTTSAITGCTVVDSSVPWVPRCEITCTWISWGFPPSLYSDHVTYWH